MTSAQTNRPSAIQLATVLPGAVPFKVGNVNETFRGQVLLADGTEREAILKDLDNLQLANELLASALLRAVGLPTPDAYLGLVRTGELQVSRAPQLADGNHLVFVSADVKVPNVTFQINREASESARQAVVARIARWSKLGDLYAFDAWIANIDRHPGNLLLSAEDEIWAIDHGHSFTGPAWEPDSLAPDGEYVNRLQQWVTPSLDAVQQARCVGQVSAISILLQTINVRSARLASLIDRLRSGAHGDAIESFLQERADKVPHHATRALGMLV
jgi:hypothetical protein